MSLVLDSSITQILCKISGEEIFKVVSSDGTVLWEAYPLGSVMEFAYTGDIQIFTAPATGTYVLEAYGAQGGDGYVCTGGAGGYSIGEISLTKGDVLYVVVGGSGGSSTKTEEYATGGYNGGGTGRGNTTSSSNILVGGGGGATHIATADGVLSTLENDRDSILLVAGGGGGAGAYRTRTDLNGGTGGGLTGGQTTGDYPNGEGGTQGAGGNADDDYKESDYYVIAGSFGQGGDKANKHRGAGGGGGYYGGGSGLYYNGGTAGGGGSGFIDNVYSGITTNGVNTGNGRAIITYKSNNIIVPDSLVLFNTYDNTIETRRWYRETKANNGWGVAECQTDSSTATWNQIDCTGYNYCTIRIKGTVESTPSGSIADHTYIKIGFTDERSEAIEVVHKWVSTEEGNIGSGQKGLASKKWYDLEIDISTLTGVQTLNVFIGGAYENGGYLHCSKITMHN